MDIANMTMIGNRLLVKTVDESEKTTGGIIIPNVAKDKPTTGKVLVAGPGIRTESGELIPNLVVVGDTILFTKGTGNEIEIDREKYVVNYKDTDITLARKEFELLALLASRPGKVFLRNEILNQVWGTEVIVGDRTIDVHIRKIRQKLNLDCITTVKGVGYKFEL